ncbi:hypothetical protein F5876DRAFT_69193 [Lentinula aff. lateritia]|uniref:Uncharacterized protein n=1 Tax=Lentinula aff. lateritia TaxID=2804960 RepID=A0ACC1TN47_9AGAR|nr:hypothetical protein F5876DRAFT_69193 [Lentinula aff. lateritia]
MERTRERMRRLKEKRKAEEEAKRKAEEERKKQEAAARAAVTRQKEEEAAEKRQKIAVAAATTGEDPDDGDDDDDDEEDPAPCERCRTKKIPCLKQAGKRNTVICSVFLLGPTNDSEARRGVKPNWGADRRTGKPDSAVTRQQPAALGGPGKGQYLPSPHQLEAGLVDDGCC